MLLDIHRMMEDAQDANLVVDQAVEDAMSSVAEPAKARADVIRSDAGERVARQQVKRFAQAEEIFGRDVLAEAEAAVGQNLVEIGIRRRGKLKQRHGGFGSPRRYPSGYAR